MTNQPPQMSELARLVKKTRELEADVAAKEAEAKALKQEHADLLDRQIPDLLDLMEVREIQTDDGLKVALKPFTDVSVPEEFRPQAFDWLVEHGQGQIIKAEVIAMFGKGDPAARELATKLQEEGHTVHLKEGIHAMTLKAWGREYLEDGTAELPDCFKVHRGRRAVITQPKAAAPKASRSSKE